jgi:hypothetical protein
MKSIALSVTKFCLAFCFVYPTQSFSQSFPERPTWSPESTSSEDLFSRSSQDSSVLISGPQNNFVIASQETAKRYESLNASQRELHRLVSTLRSTDDAAEKDKLLKRMLAVVGNQFAERQAIREDELNALESKLKKLREVHEKRNQQKDKIVQDRVTQILKDVEGLGWGSDSISEFPGRDPNFSGPESPGVLPSQSISPDISAY